MLYRPPILTRRNGCTTDTLNVILARVRSVLEKISQVRICRFMLPANLR